MTDTTELTDQEWDDIRELAYGKFVARGCEDGHDVEDWLAAEHEVRACRFEPKAESCVPQPSSMKSRRAVTATDTATVD